MTPREVAIWADAWYELRREEWEGQLTQAYVTARLMRAEKLPDKASDLFPKPSVPELTETPTERALRIRSKMDAWAKKANRKERAAEKKARRNG